MALTPRTIERIIAGSCSALLLIVLVGLGWYEQAKAADVARVATVSILQHDLARYYGLHSRYPKAVPDTVVYGAPANEVPYEPLTSENQPCTTDECDTYAVPFMLDTNAVGLLRGPHTLTPQGIR